MIVLGGRLEFVEFVPLEIELLECFEIIFEVLTLIAVLVALLLLKSSDQLFTGGFELFPGLIGLGWEN